MNGNLVDRNLAYRSSNVDTFCLGVFVSVTSHSNIRLDRSSSIEELHRFSIAPCICMCMKWTDVLLSH